MALNSIVYGQYIYLIQERESIRCNDNVYKIGKTTQEPNSRMKGYPKGSKLYLTIIVDDATKSEQDLLAVFRKKFVLRREFGNEYFYGNVVDMMREIIEYQRDAFHVDEVEEEEATDESEEEEEEERKITKPVMLGTYTRKLASVVEEQESAMIHVNYLKDNLFEVDRIDVYDGKVLSYTLDKEEVPFDLDQDPNLIQLNPYHVKKFKCVEKTNWKKYIINVCSFELKSFRRIKYYKTLFLIDKK